MKIIENGTSNWMREASLMAQLDDRHILQLREVKSSSTAAYMVSQKCFPTRKQASRIVWCFRIFILAHHINLVDCHVTALLNKQNHDYSLTLRQIMDMAHGGELFERLQDGPLDETSAALMAKKMLLPSWLVH